jgi:carbonic anhydrase
VRQLATRSTVIAEQIEAGTLAIVGATYHLSDGRVQTREYLGDIGE